MRRFLLILSKLIVNLHATILQLLQIHAAVPVKQYVKRLLYRYAPRLAVEYFSARSRAHAHRFLKKSGCWDVNEALFTHLGDVVQAGPFQGVRLTATTRSEQWGPFLLGTYESELDVAWSVVFAGTYRQIIDIGAKFGYYAVGLARRYPTAQVIAFDTDFWARRATREMAIANATPNVEVRGYCDVAWLPGHVLEPAFLFCDCEGFESQLFSESVVGRLRQSTLLIETHDCFVPNVTKTLQSIFAPTHRVHAFDSGRGTRTTDCDLRFLTEEQLPLATCEIRTDQQWLLCLPNEGPNSSLNLAR